MYDKQDLDQAKFLQAVAGVLAGAIRGLAHQVLVAPAIYDMHLLHNTCAEFTVPATNNYLILETRMENIHTVRISTALARKTCT